mmetsp:Transcript_17530/g.28030  ORF Transcript_17530/g.28030 Transcript_17530/m.28030 type:complete len:155 (+) Transcript_17530:72-536(+)|eukprot:jgi/Bigna1/89090/estExt_fgenesh1_pg.C_430090
MCRITDQTNAWKIETSRRSKRKQRRQQLKTKTKQHPHRKVMTAEQVRRMKKSDSRKQRRLKKKFKKSMLVETTIDDKSLVCGLQSKGTAKAEMMPKPMVGKMQNKERTQTVASIGVISVFKSNRTQLGHGSHWAVVATKFISCFRQWPLHASQL